MPQPRVLSLDEYTILPISVGDVSILVWLKLALVTIQRHHMRIRFERIKRTADKMAHSR